MLGRRYPPLAACSWASLGHRTPSASLPRSPWGTSATLLPLCLQPLFHFFLHSLYFFSNPACCLPPAPSEQLMKRCLFGFLCATDQENRKRGLVCDLMFVFWACSCLHDLLMGPASAEVTGGHLVCQSVWVMLSTPHQKQQRKPLQSKRVVG